MTDRPTVLVTGASSGIGAAFAWGFAARGADLVLVARRVDRLEALAAEVRAAHGVRVDVVPADLAVPGAADRLAAELAERGLRLTGLVNDAGFGVLGDFHEADPERLRAMLQVNVVALTDLCRVFVGQLRDSGRGVLVNVASMGGVVPAVGWAAYGATKAYVLHLTEALAAESAGTGLRVLAVAPGVTRTEFFDGSDEAVAGVGGVQTPQDVVATTFRALDRRRTRVVSGWRNAVLVGATRVLPRRVLVGAATRLRARAARDA